MMNKEQKVNKKRGADRSPESKKPAQKRVFEKKSEVLLEKLSNSVEFEHGPGNDDKEFAHLYAKQHGTRINLFISGRKLARDVKENKFIHLADDKAITIDSVLNMEGVSVMRTSLDENLFGLFCGAHALNEKISEAQSSKKDTMSVLVHCTKGCERSVTTVLTYLMCYQGYDYEGAALVLNKALTSGRDVRHAEQGQQGKTDEQCHNGNIADKFFDVKPDAMRQRMENAMMLSEFFLSKQKTPKSFEQAYQTNTTNDIETKIIFPTFGRAYTSQAKLSLPALLTGSQFEKAINKEATRNEFNQYRAQHETTKRDIVTTHETLSRKSNVSITSETEIVDEQSAAAQDAHSASMNSVAAQSSNLANKIQVSQEAAKASENPGVSKEDSNQSTPSTPPSPR